MEKTRNFFHSISVLKSKPTNPTDGSTDHDNILINTVGVIAHTTMYIFKYTNESLGFKKANLDQWMGN